MKLLEFFRVIYEDPYKDDYIVRLKYKYDHETIYTITNELLLLEDDCQNYTWYNDWNEGQKDVEVLCYIKVGDVFKECSYVSKEV